MFGAPWLDLQPQGQQGFAAEVRHDLKAREPPSIRRAHACLAYSLQGPTVKSLRRCFSAGLLSKAEKEREEEKPHILNSWILEHKASGASLKPHTPHVQARNTHTPLALNVFHFKHVLYGKKLRMKEKVGIFLYRLAQKEKTEWRRRDFTRLRLVFTVLI